VSKDVNLSIVLSPIRTFTVGSGIPPDQPSIFIEGSRAFTAGREFHPAPRVRKRFN